MTRAYRDLPRKTSGAPDSDKDSCGTALWSANTNSSERVFSHVRRALSSCGLSAKPAERDCPSVITHHVRVFCDGHRHGRGIRSRARCGRALPRGVRAAGRSRWPRGAELAGGFRTAGVESLLASATVAARVSRPPLLLRAPLAPPIARRKRVGIDLDGLDWPPRADALRTLDRGGSRRIRVRWARGRYRRLAQRLALPVVLWAACGWAASITRAHGRAVDAADSRSPAGSRITRSAAAAGTTSLRWRAIARAAAREHRVPPVDEPHAIAAPRIGAVAIIELTHGVASLADSLTPPPGPVVLLPLPRRERGARSNRMSSSLYHA